ncbi:hypothetical protein COY90_03330 [Candidatus Roizmanbacteria bacterium CG_4_10_14_0_8_um_filter_39_9]|uniref:Uncharacterized protein n=1 Tax=Candidatus Roizmanbacteria bacterium CG_4_10_14_0_8_um_filter_39_9 TaxID=1974829 RepID=A0A2M7QDJ3_9BACT|nr:MAG: hypothetical protein COY90_03330 [Candidatus Roizmanbacteria bacterium CG_4_10_14_0_8_um_filter_39_9]
MILNFLFTSTPLKFMVQSFWRDEAFSYLMAKRSILDLLILTARDANPPIYYLALKIWMTLFGSSEVALRSLSLIFFFATIYVVFLILTGTFGVSVKKSYLYLLIFVANPLLHYYAFEARMYTMLAFFASLSFYFLFQKKYTSFTVAVILGLYTHYFMIFTFIPYLIYFYMQGRILHERKALFQSLKNICLALCPWILFVVLIKIPQHAGFWIQKPTLETFIDLPALLLTGYEPDLWYLYMLLTPLSILLFGMIAYGIFMFKKQNIRHRPKKVPLTIFYALIGWAFAVPVLILTVSFFIPIFLPRYMIFVTVGFLLLLIFLIEYMPRQVQPFMFLFLIFFSVNYGTLQIDKRDKAHIQKPLLEIKKMLKEGDVVYVTHEYNFHPAQYYLGEKVVYMFGKTYEELPWFVGKILIPKEKIAASLPSYPHKAFILKDDLSYSIQAIY